MATQFKLLGKEISAHYPLLWQTIDAMGANKNTRKFPLTLSYITFCLQFEDWLAVFTDVIAYTLDAHKPFRLPQKDYGMNKNVPVMLDYVCNHTDKFLLADKDLAQTFIAELDEWHMLITMRTNPTEIPIYNSRQKCPSCRHYSLMKQTKIVFCANVGCAWVQA